MISVDEALSEIVRGADSVISMEGLKAKLEEGRPLRIKLGMDPTAPDIHLGHTVILNKLRVFQKLGHEIILIIGDFTAAVDRHFPEKRFLKTPRPMLNRLSKFLIRKRLRLFIIPNGWKSSVLQV